MKSLELKSPQFTTFIKTFFIRIKKKHRCKTLPSLALLLLTPIIYIFKRDMDILYFGFGAGAILLTLLFTLFFLKALLIYLIFLRPKQDVYALSQNTLFKINGKRIILLEDMYSFFSISAVNLKSFKRDEENRTLSLELYEYEVSSLYEIIITSNVKHKSIYYSDECKGNLQIIEKSLNQTVLRSKRAKSQILRLLLRHPMLIIFGVIFIILYVLSNWCD